MINDGHIHLHYGMASYDNRIRISKEMRKVDQKRIENNVDKMGAIILPSDVNIFPQLLKNRPFLRPGLYFRDGKEVEEYVGPIRQFDFVKFHIPFYSASLERIDEALRSGLKKGFRRFQFHTDVLTEEILQIYANFISETDAKIYLVHGVYTLHPRFLPYAKKSACPENLKNWQETFSWGRLLTMELMMFRTKD